LEAIRVVEAVLFRAVIKYESFDGSFTFFRPFVTSFFGLQNLFSLQEKSAFLQDFHVALIFATNNILTTLMLPNIG